MRLLFTGGQVGWMMYTSFPRTFSWTITLISPSAKDDTVARPRLTPRSFAISSDSAMFPFPLKSLRPPPCFLALSVAASRRASSGVMVVLGSALGSGAGLVAAMAAAGGARSSSSAAGRASSTTGTSGAGASPAPSGRSVRRFLSSASMAISALIPYAVLGSRTAPSLSHWAVDAVAARPAAAAAAAIRRCDGRCRSERWPEHDAACADKALVAVDAAANASDEEPDAGPWK